MGNDSEDILGLFKPEVFQSIRIELSIMNSANRAKFRSEPGSKLIEMTDEGFVLEVPDRSCAAKQNLIVDAKAIPTSGDPIFLEVTANIGKLEHGNDGTDRIDLTIIQVDEVQWKKFRGIFDARQEEVTNFLLAARGYG